LAGCISVDKRPKLTSSFRVCNTLNPDCSMPASSSNSSQWSAPSEGAVARRTTASSGGGYNGRGPPIPCHVENHPYAYEPPLLCRCGLKTPRWIGVMETQDVGTIDAARQIMLLNFFLVHYVFAMQMLKSRCTYGNLVFS
jgi:hypothetical protein